MLMEFESLKILKHGQCRVIRVRGRVYGHPHFDSGQSIWTSGITLLDEQNDLIITSNGSTYHLTEASLKSKKYTILRDLARKVKISSERE